ncbi:hypothetical protein P43SY_001966 [Pythium insidiosum]|uniref:C2 domain-containing protein n=1 Tax=Pythium insidiosum TaxID=114742 RepID=A0AAD5QEM1_PYTIN|nr:hypothetical protein P43SY_001966 [Pythium insidiosum]
MTLWSLLGFLLALGATVTVGVLTLVAALGDRALTWAAQRYAKDYVGDSFELSWSLRDGALEVRRLALGRALLAVVEPMLGLPMDLEKVRLEQFRLEIPLWTYLVARVGGNQDKNDKESVAKRPALRSAVIVSGLQLALSVNEPEKWIWMKEDNIERFQQAIVDAAAARIARANAWTATVAQKLVELASRRAAAATPAPPAPTTAPAQPSAPPAWQLLVDEIIDSFAIVVRTVSITIRDDHAAAGIGVSFEKFEIGRGQAQADLFKRDINLDNFEIFVNPSAASSRVYDVIKPLDMHIALTMPPIFRGIAMQQTVGPRVVDVDISFREWHQRAMLMDEAKCTELTDAEKAEYMALYREQWHHDNVLGFVNRLASEYKLKDQLRARRQRLGELEASNRSGLDFRLRVKKGYACTVEQHRQFFNGEKGIPMLINAAADKATIVVKPYQETPKAYESVNISCQNNEQTIHAIITDISSSPRYRIENRSTRHAFRYLQDGIKGVEEILIKPLESHSFVWENPLQKQKILKILYIDGQTRVFAAGDAPIYAADRHRAAFDDWLSSMCIDFKITGFGLSIVDGRPQEMLNMTIEDIRVTSATGTRKCAFSVHHMQIDDMTPNALYPVVLAPIDSGFNSDKREGWLPMDGERPFVTVTFTTEPPAGITVVDEFVVDLHSSVVRLNLEYVFRLLNLIFEFLPTSDEDAQIQYGVDQKNWLLTNDLSVPDEVGYGGSLMYFKKWSLSSFEFHLVFDSAAEEHGDGISSILGSTIGSIVGGIAHVTPEFQFDAIVYENRFFYQYDLIYAVVWDIVLSVVGQWYKIVGSVELLGDPVGLATDIVDGFALAARQLKRDVKGKSLRKGESALTLVQTVVGAPMKSIGKVSNGLGDVLKKATDFQSQEEANQPRHVPEGLLQGGVVLTKSLAYGVKGFIKEPVRGAKKDGVVGFAKGVGRGTLQLVASPFVGTLGVVEKISMSVNNTTHLLDEKSYDGPRRPPRDLSASPLKPLTDSNVITEVELHVLYVEGLPSNSNPKVVIRVYQQAPGCPARTVGKLKSSTLHHTGTPKFDQSWLLTITSPDTFIELNVYHKRKPIPKKLLGHLTLSMEDIYRDFDGVPSTILSDSKAKTRLRKRRRFNGSILDELAQSGTQILDVRDDSWRQKVSRASMINVMDTSFEDENDENELYEEDVEMLSSRSIVMDPASAVPHRQVARPLLDSESGATIHLSIRYVNDMRRLPYVHTASEIQEMRFWKTTPRESNKIPDPVKRAKNHTSRLINAQLAKLSSITRQASLQFPALRGLHPFEREVVVLTLGQGVYEKHVQELRKVYAALHNVGKRHEKETQTQRTKQEAVDCGLRCIEELRQVVEEHADTLQQAAAMAKTLRGLPTVDVAKPIFAFVGAPNVGNDQHALWAPGSLVLTRGMLQVANYPFTTRGITMGHIFVEGESFQAHTPGLIYRPDAQRNAIEKLALAMMEKTEAAIGFVFDPTGNSGTSLQDQLRLRQELHDRVAAARGDHAWMDIISKIDIPVPATEALRAQLPDAFSVSTATNEGLAPLGEEIRSVLTSQ